MCGAGAGSFGSVLVASACGGVVVASACDGVVRGRRLAMEWWERRLWVGGAAAQIKKKGGRGFGLVWWGRRLCVLWWWWCGASPRCEFGGFGLVRWLCVVEAVRRLGLSRAATRIKGGKALARWGGSANKRGQAWLFVVIGGRRLSVVWCGGLGSVGRRRG